MLGMELNLKRGSWLRNVVLEYLYTKYQSGPIYHDHTPGRSDHLGGRDNYYNHYIYGGWQHWGQAMGNPLYRSPIYNKDGKIDFQDNRFRAFHLGWSGQPADWLDYRVLGTWQRSEEHTSELQSRQYLVCRLLLEKKNNTIAAPLLVHIVSLYLITLSFISIIYLSSFSVNPTILNYILPRHSSIVLQSLSFVYFFL